MLHVRTSLVVQWLRLCASNTVGASLIPVQGNKIPHASLWGQKKVIFKGGWKEKIRCSSTTRGNGEQGGEAIFEDLEAEDISKAMK